MEKRFFLLSILLILLGMVFVGCANDSVIEKEYNDLNGIWVKKETSSYDGIVYNYHEEIKLNNGNWERAEYGDGDRYSNGVPYAKGTFITYYNIIEFTTTQYSGLYLDSYFDLNDDYEITDIDLKKLYTKNEFEAFLKNSGKISTEQIASMIDIFSSQSINSYYLSNNKLCFIYTSVNVWSSGGYYPYYHTTVSTYTINYTRK